MSTKHVIGVDIGGTKVLAGIVDAEGRVHATLERPTVTTSQSALLEDLADLVLSLPQDGVEAVGFGIPTRIDHAHGVALGSVNIPLRDVPFRDWMQDRLGLPVEIENDASCATFAEYRFGAGRGASDFVMLTLGTGVGGGVVSGGKLFRAYTELGHMVIVADGAPCQGACSGRGHLEAYCSGRAADNRARELLGDHASAYDLVQERHPVLDEIGHYLGIGIGSLVNIFGPTRVVIGGGFGLGAFDLLLPATRLAVLTEALQPSGQELEIEHAEMPQAGLIGAALVALGALEALEAL
jgi:glucokinase